MTAPSSLRGPLRGPFDARSSSGSTTGRSDGGATRHPLSAIMMLKPSTRQFSGGGGVPDPRVDHEAHLHGCAPERLRVAAAGSWRLAGDRRVDDCVTDSAR